MAKEKEEIKLCSMNKKKGKKGKKQVNKEIKWT